MSSSRILKRKVWLTVTTGLLVLAVPFAVLADSPATTSTQPTSTQTAASITQEQAIEAAKKFYPVPDRYVMSNVSYQSPTSYSFWTHGVWHIMFDDPKSERPGYPSDGVSFMVDAQTGKVLSMNRMSPAATDAGNSITADQGKQIAADLLKKLVPDQASSVRLQEGDSNFSFGKESGLHRYNFIRLVNGVPYPNDSVGITLDEQGGLFGYNNVWSDDLTFPSEKPSVSEVQAQAAYSKSFLATLQYNITNYNNQESTATLTYEPYGANGIGAFPIIDAMTGQVIDQSGQASGDATPPVFTPLIDHAAPLPAKELTKDQVMEIVKQFPIALDGYDLNSMNYQTGDSNQDPMWYLSYSKKGTNDSLQIAVDSKTGDLRQFFQPMRGNEDSTQTPKISYEQAQQTAINWLIKVLPSRVNHIALEPASVTGKMENGTYVIRFVQLQDGIPCSDIINVSVNGQTGAIENFYSPLLPKTVFPSKEQAISAETAKQDYLTSGEFPLTLQYMPVYANNVHFGHPQKVMLVYSAVPNDQPAEQLNAITGEWVSPFSGVTGDVSAITDIKGHWAEKYMATLFEKGIFKPEDNKLLPNKEVTRGEAVRALVILSQHYFQTNNEQPFFSDVPPSDPNYTYVQQAARLSWIGTNSDKFRPGDNLTREELAEWIATALGYSDLTKVPGALNNHFLDMKNVDAEHVNDIAVAATLQLMTGNGQSFRPHDVVTRAELAKVMSQLGDRLQHKG